MSHPATLPLGSPITGQGKAGRFIWARAHYEGTEVALHVGPGHAVELPAAEFERRRRATSWEWPLLNCVLDGVSRDQLMAGHQSNHITIAYVDEAAIDDVLRALGIASPTLRVFTINGQFERDRGRVLAADDELTAIPPVGGG